MFFISDVELLDACREEFHRRLKVYHAWKLKNRKDKNPSVHTENDDQRAPKDILNNGRKSLFCFCCLLLNYLGSSVVNGGKKPSNDKTSGEQRYFRIPFLRPNEKNRDTNNDQTKKGWWYAHFDGKSKPNCLSFANTFVDFDSDKWIARQMEIHPDKKTVLLAAGIDDMNMCELSLDETGLPSKKGAEILEKDFEQEWNKHGGKEYLKSHRTQISSKYVSQLI